MQFRSPEHDWQKNEKKKKEKKKKKNRKFQSILRFTQMRKLDSLVNTFNQVNEKYLIKVD